MGERLSFLPLPPDTDVVVSELIPPRVQHGVLAAPDPFTRHAAWGRDKLV